MKNIIYIILFLFPFFSCQDSKKEKITLLVQEWEGKEIKFPSNSVFTIQGKDTVNNFPHSNAAFKIVTYVDSIGCMSCKLQLPKWKDFIKEIDSLAKDPVAVLFYFHPNSLKEMRYITRRDGFEYPVCFDGKDSFNRLNHFPEEMAFQTFLLNRNNHVIVMGNPVHNPRVKELYMNLIQQKPIQERQKPLTTAAVNHRRIDFGIMKTNQTKIEKIEMENTGTVPLYIEAITTSCGCTTVKFDKQPARAGEKLNVYVTYKAEEVGLFNKYISIYCNTRNAPIRISVTGEVNR